MDQQHNQKVLILPANTEGRDFVIGDIHGEFDKVEALMSQASFDPTKDRLLSVGDLVDRGPQSKDALDWLKQDWFFAVRGNHEQMVVDSFIAMVDETMLGSARRDIKQMHVINGGEWFWELSGDQQAKFAGAFNKLPYVIEVPVGDKRFGLVHAEPLSSWTETKDAAESVSQFAINTMMWSRWRIQDKDTTPVAGIDAVFVGHTPTRDVVKLGNIFYIDQGACFGRKMTMVDLTTLEVYQT